MQFERKVKEYISAESKDQAEKQTLDNAMMEMISQQAQSKNFVVKNR